MKKHIKKHSGRFITTLLMCGGLLGWVFFLSKMFVSEAHINFASTYIIAPISETLFYLYLPLLLAYKIKERYGFDIIIPIMLIVAFQFILLHEHNYSIDGRYLACVVQGFMYFCTYILLRNYWKSGGFWYAVIFHSVYNIGVNNFIT